MVIHRTLCRFKTKPRQRVIMICILQTKILYDRYENGVLNVLKYFSISTEHTKCFINLSTCINHNAGFVFPNRLTDVDHFNTVSI